MIVNETDLAYIAGFMDAEGSICINKVKTYYYYLRVCITNTNLPVMDYIRKIVGEKILTYYYRGQVSNLVIYSRNAKLFLEKLLPYLHVKRPQAELALEFQSKMCQEKLTIPKREQENYKIQITNLNRNGRTKEGLGSVPMGKISLPYIAGFFDGEGCVCILKVMEKYLARVRTRYILRIYISNTNLPILKNIQRLLGGYISERPNPPKNHLQVYSLTLNCNKAKEFLEKVLPYLIVKKEQAVLAIEFQSKMKKGKRTMSSSEQASYKARISSLNKIRYDLHFNQLPYLKGTNNRNLAIPNL